jgi:hypothetical protein
MNISVLISIIMLMVVVNISPSAADFPHRAAGLGALQIILPFILIPAIGAELIADYISTEIKLDPNLNGKTNMPPKIGLLLSDENDGPWLSCWARPGAAIPDAENMISKWSGSASARSICAPRPVGLVIDRLAYWHYQPREWLKKSPCNDVTC